MMGKTHQVGGVSAAAITTVALYASGVPLAVENPEVLPVILIGGWLGGMMPDIDHPNATISKWKLLGVPVFKPVSWLVNVLFGHRGATHTVWALLLTWLPFIIGPLLLPPEWVLGSILLTLFGIGYAMGYMSHIILDSLTPSGTPMMWPLPDVRLARIPTGKYDGIVRTVLVLLTMVVCVGILFFFG